MNYMGVAILFPLLNPLAGVVGSYAVDHAAGRGWGGKGRRAAYGTLVQHLLEEIISA